MSEPPDLGRRDFLGLATWAMAGIISAGMGIPAIAYIIGPALQRNKAAEWIRLGSTSKIELGNPTLFKAKIQRQTGWISDEEEIAVFAITDNGRDFVAMSNICTHLGCRVRWIAEKGQFLCPCHNAVFDREGNVVSGPPPAPLNRYEVKVEDDQLFVKGA